MGFGKQGAMGGFGSGGVLGSLRVPAWVLRNPSNVPAVLDIDYTNSRQWFNGAAYQTEASLLTAAGASSSGITRTFGPYVDPANSELLANPTPTDTTGWTNVNSGLSSVVNNELVLEGNGGTNPSVEQSFVSAAGHAYKVQGTYRKGTSTGTSVIIASNVSALTPVTTMPGNATTSDVTNSFVFGAENTASYIALRIAASAVSGTVIGHGFSVKECLPFKGFSFGISSGIVAGITPAAASGNQVLLEISVSGTSSGERNRVRIVWDATGHLHFITTTNNSENVNLDLGVVSGSTAFQIEFTVAAARFAARLNTGTSLFSTSISVPSMGLLYFGRSPTGETWTGSITRVTLFASERMPSDMIYVEGDSYAQSVGGVSITTSLVTASGRGAFTTGLGGSYISAELARIQANPNLQTGIFVSWDGDANTGAPFSDYMSYMNQVVPSLRTSKYIIIPPCRRNNKTAGDNATTLQIQQAIAAAYPNNYYDAQAFLATLANGTTDNADVAAGYIPTSLLQADLTHLLATPMNSLAANLWTNTIAPRGW